MVALSSKGKEAIDKILSDAVEQGKIPGLSFAATNIDEEIYFGKAGLRIIDDPASGEVDEESVFWVCSQTKLIVSIAILQLVEKGKIGFDTRIEEILPEFANPIILDDPFADKPTYKPAKTPITLAHLLNHSSGLYYSVKPRNPPAALPIPYTAAHSKTNPIGHFYDLIKEGLPGMPLLFEPGTNFAYGYNIDVIGFIVQKLTGKYLEDYCKENIFEPLGMKTTFHVTPEMKKKHVGLNFRKSDGTLVPCTEEHMPLTPQDDEDVHVCLGGVGMHSTLRDYLALLRHLLQIHAGRATNPILSTETVHKLFEPTLTDDGVKSLNTFNVLTDSQWSIGLCMNVTDWPGARRKGSGCWYGWAGTYYFVDPTTGIAAVYGTQIVPTRDKEVVRVWAEGEKALYAGLEA
ncbi:beta-lactamase/transpeptidase-like protein [Crucibulum laeve]|uniref:Beta-lactamase/transpeptidase-like protein n=1 Tax=Crucibulum laeve TaxID=68775 RepID=A0A5C3LGZ6_9AGAR|nr:beta-lactamase/transpeptidase-like protein [Crucibulum laeve]